ncbi:histidinol-phosphate transaminase [Thiomicrorhabdus aquaedulcis]|uniref:histidinol-phosphate transaminase n=1 Tax=Thiomicrorhabdus aquaedulcis TaxID=2211106 RepID=UPI000FD8ED1B|nr:histidinol-phosphate transaminase [Thiomicrorhabdus aquaedulcis]
MSQPAPLVHSTASTPTALTSSFKEVVLPQILGIHPYVPGKPISELQRELGLTRITKLASNENPLGASPKVLEAIHQALVDIARYPDGSAYELKTELAHFLKCQTNQLVIGNGSNELLELVARAFAGPGDEIVYSQYAFAVYPISAQVVGATGVEVTAKNWGHDLDAMANAITAKTKVVYLANPNNPTGTLFNRQAWEAFISRVPAHVIVVLDEAYVEYAQAAVNAQDYLNGMAYINAHPNVLVSRTFSKAYGLASLRVGYMAGTPEIIGYLNQLRAPFNINQLAQVAAVAALKDAEFVQKGVALNQQGMQQIITALNELNIESIASVANFLCINLGEKAAKINQMLLQKGVIVRPVANYGLTQFLRVSIGTHAENAHFIEALRASLQEQQA